MLLAKRVTGEEEVPEGCVAVVTPDAPDVLSHVSVRARNMRVFFGICHEPEPLAAIEALAGRVRCWLRLTWPASLPAPFSWASLRSVPSQHTSAALGAGTLWASQL